MDLKLFTLLIKRYLFLSWMTKKKQKQGSAVGVVVPILGIAVGVFAFTVIIAIMSGFVVNIKRELIKFQPHLQIISPNENEIQENLDLIKKIKSISSSEIVEVSPFVTGDAILQNSNQGTMISVVGIDAQTALTIYDINDDSKFNSKHLKRSLSTLMENPFTKTKIPSIVVGSKLAESLDLKIGDTITLMSILSDEGLAPLQIPFIVSGTFQSGRSFFDSKNVFISIASAQKFFSKPNKWTGLNIKLKHPFSPDNLVNKINLEISSSKLKTFSWLDSNSALLKALKLEHIGMSFVTLMIIFVGCFSITISLLISLRRKTRELAILQSLGLTKKDLSLIYLGQGFFIGLTGIILGLIVSSITLYLVSHYSIPYITTSYSNEPLPVILSYTDITVISVGSLILSVVAAILPALEVKNLNITEILSLRS